LAHQPVHRWVAYPESSRTVYDEELGRARRDDQLAQQQHLPAARDAAAGQRADKVDFGIRELLPPDESWRVAADDLSHDGAGWLDGGVPGRPGVRDKD